MIFTSKKALEGLDLNMDLIVSHEMPKEELPILSLGGAKVRLENKSSGIRYWLFRKENPGDFHLHLEMIKTLLPVSEIIIENAVSQK
jgi:hypothetical protein